MSALSISALAAEPVEETFDKEMLEEEARLEEEEEADNSSAPVSLVGELTEAIRVGTMVVNGTMEPVFMRSDDDQYEYRMSADPQLQWWLNVDNPGVERPGESIWATWDESDFFRALEDYERLFAVMVLRAEADGTLDGDASWSDLLRTEPELVRSSASLETSDSLAATCAIEELRSTSLRRRRVLAWQRLSRLKGAGPVQTNPKRVAAAFVALLQLMERLENPLDNERWAGMWWRAGVAMRIAEKSTGASITGRPGSNSVLAMDAGSNFSDAESYLTQAAAISQTTLASLDLPPTVKLWLDEADDNAAETETALIRIEMPLGTLVSIDGTKWIKPDRGITLERVVPAGVHRISVQRYGERPIALWLDVEPSDTVDGKLVDAVHMTLNPPPDLDADTWLARNTVDWDDGRVRQQTTARLRKRFQWNLQILGVATSHFARPSFGPELTVTYRHEIASVGPRANNSFASIGFGLGGAALTPTAPFLLNANEQLRTHARLHAHALLSFALRKTDLELGFGAFVDPRLSIGPHSVFGVSYDLGQRLAIMFQGRVGWDAAVHAEGIPRITGGGAIGFVIQ